MKTEQILPYLEKSVEVTDFVGDRMTGILHYNDTDIYRGAPYFLDPHSTVNRPRFKKSHIRKIRLIEHESISDEEKKEKDSN